MVKFVLSLAAILSVAVVTTVCPLKITTEDGTENGLFGSSLSMNSNILAIGSMGDRYQNKKRTGSIYVFSQLNSNSWTLSQKLFPDRVQSYDQFGCSVSLGINMLFAGALNSKESNVNTGKVFVWSKVESGSWSQQSELNPTNLSAYDEFGKEIAHFHNTVAISAPGDDEIARDCGAVYIFCGESKWSVQVKLVPEDGREDQYFGSALAIDNNGLLVGSSDGKVANSHGANVTIGQNGYGFNVYYFEGVGGSWSVQARLTHSERKSNDQFGWSVAMSGDNAIIGARYADSDIGAAYSFTRKRCGDVACWTQGVKLVPTDAAPMYFGDQIFFRNSLAMIGAYGWMDKTHDNAMMGCAYVFHMEISSGSAAWTQQSRIVPRESQPSSYFGRSLAYSTETNVVAVGASSDSINSIPTGAVYLYRYANGQVIDDSSIADDSTGSHKSAIKASDSSNTTPIIGVLLCFALCTVSLGYYMCCLDAKVKRRRTLEGLKTDGFSCLSGDDSMHTSLEFDDTKGTYELAARDLVAGDGEELNGNQKVIKTVSGYLEEGIYASANGVENLLLQVEKKFVTLMYSEEADKTEGQDTFVKRDATSAVIATKTDPASMELASPIH